MDIKCTDEDIKFLKDQYEGDMELPEIICLNEMLALREALKELDSHIRTNDGRDIIYRLKCRGLL